MSQAREAPRILDRPPRWFERELDELPFIACWTDLAGLSGEARFSRMEGALSDRELARCHGLGSPASQLEFLAARTLARVLLARATGNRVREVVIDESSGKPALAAPGHLRFNLSHCATHVLVGLAHHEVGVDVETIRPFNQALARRACDRHELEELARLPGEALPGAFCHLWTAKEACVKVSGAGVSFGLRKVHATLEGAGRWADLSWWSLDVGPAARAAVAVRWTAAGEGLAGPVGADELLEHVTP